MKEFEKWHRKNIYADRSQTEKAWKAALEWAANEILECLSPQDALEMIREELEIKK